MTNPSTLLQYLQSPLPRLIVDSQSKSQQNTTNRRYSWEDIHTLGHWEEFNLNQILQDFPLLTEVHMINVPVATSPPDAIRREPEFKGLFKTLIDPRVRRGLRATFAHLIQAGPLMSQSVLTIGEGERAMLPDEYTPDRSFFDETLSVETRPNRAPGDLKVSWKWSTELQLGNIVQDQQFKQVLSQVNWYMKLHGARYGFVCTNKEFNKEFVAVRRLDAQGNLELSDPVAWEQATPGLTVPLALWYLAMLASDDEQWSLNDAIQLDQ